MHNALRVQVFARLYNVLTRGASMTWLAQTLRQYPEIAVFLSLGIGYWVGGKCFKGFSLGAVTATLLAAIAIGQLGITISPNVKSVFFLLFLFAVGYGVGPQFVRGIAKDGIPKAIFSVVQCVLCFAVPVIAAKLAGYSVGSAAGLFAGSQTISASMGLATDAINRIGLPADETRTLLNAMPTAYTVSYIFGTVGSALILATLGPKLLGIDLVAALKEYEASLGGAKELGGAGQAWHQYELRAYKIPQDARAIGLTVGQAEALAPNGSRLYIERIRRGAVNEEARIDTVLQPGDVVAIVGPREQLVSLLGPLNTEVDDPELLAVPAEGVDVYVYPPHQARPDRDADPGAAEHEAASRRHHHDRRPHAGYDGCGESARYDRSAVRRRRRRVHRRGDHHRRADRCNRDQGRRGAAHAVHRGRRALIAGIVFGWLRAIHPTFGRIQESTLWFMNSVGLNVFIAVVGITAGPGFVAGLQQLGISLFLWGIFATAVPLILGMFIAKHVFRFHPAILLGVCAGARTTTAALGMICDAAKSQVPGLGYTVTYAVGNTLLTIWGMIVAMLLS
jgi:putative transport protein